MSDFKVGDKVEIIVNGNIERESVVDGEHSGVVTLECGTAEYWAESGNSVVMPDDIYIRKVEG